MKKVILSIALVAGLGAMTSASAGNTSNEKTTVVTVLQDDGFVDVKFEELNEKVQASVKGLIQDYDLNAIQYNAEKQIAKVDATKKDDQSKKTFYFDAEGKEITMEAAPAEQKTEETTEQKETQETPSIESFDAVEDSAFVDVKFEELSEKVQVAVREIHKVYDLNAIQYNAENQITKVRATKRDDQSKKEFFLDAEGKEVAMEAAPVEQKMGETTQQEETPSIGSFDVTQDDGFVAVKAEELNENVQAAVAALGETYQVDALFFNAEKQITKVDATKKDDQSKKTIYLDSEGKEVTLEPAAEEKVEETTQQEETPSIGSFDVTQDDGFVAVKVEELNENVQAAVAALGETYQVDALFFNAEKQITKVDATKKDDQSKKTIYLDSEGVETTLEQPAQNSETQEQM